MARRVIEVFRAGRVGADGLSNLIGVVTTGVDAAVLNEDSGKAYRCTGALTLTLPAATAPGWSVIVDADGGDVTLASSMTVNGAASILLSDGNSCLIYSDGSALFARFYYSDEIASSNLTGFAAIDPATVSVSPFENTTSLYNINITYQNPYDVPLFVSMGLLTAAASTIMTLKFGATVSFGKTGMQMSQDDAKRVGVCGMIPPNNYFIFETNFAGAALTSGGGVY